MMAKKNKIFKEMGHKMEELGHDMSKGKFSRTYRRKSCKRYEKS